MALPKEVLEALAAAEGAEDTSEPQPSPATTAPAGSWLATLFRRLADIFAKSANGDKGDDLAYGYPPVTDKVTPPAYGVPVHILIDLVRQAHKLLSQVKDSLEGEEKKQVEALLDRIEQAFGTAAQKTDAPSQSACDAVLEDYGMGDRNAFWTEFRLAVKASAPTQPVLAPLEAADRLQKAWQGVVELVSTTTLEEGNVFSAFFALRTAVDAAVRTLRSTAANPSDSAAFHDGSDTASVGDRDQSDAADSTAMERPAAPSPSDAVIAEGATSHQPAEPQGADAERLQALVGSIVAAAMEPFIAELKALQETVQALQERVEKRRRVTQAIASATPSNGTNDQKDIAARWMTATTDAERRQLLKEAQKLLAAPLPVRSGEE